MTKANKPINLERGRIVVDDIDIKNKLVKIAKNREETIKGTITRLVSKEYEEFEKESKADDQRYIQDNLQGK